MQTFYICPRTKKPLREHNEGLLRDDDLLYPFIQGSNNINIPNFIAHELDGSEKLSPGIYDQKILLRFTGIFSIGYLKHLT